jgi:hypothetical protein
VFALIWTLYECGYIVRNYGAIRKCDAYSERKCPPPVEEETPFPNTKVLKKVKR